MSAADLGGDPPCWAHLHEDDDDERGEEVVDLRKVPSGSGGVVWSLPHGGDLDANLVRLGAGDGIGAHVNDDVDVLLVVRSGAADLTVDGRIRAIGPDHVALIPRGSERSIEAGADGIAYLSIHRRRSPLVIARPDTDTDTDR